jgi:hypothetical protein
MKYARIPAALLFVAFCMLAAPAPAAAYIGPGAGISAIGTVVAFVAAIFFALVGFIWYPFKRLIAFVRSKLSPQNGDQPIVP